ncbi:MAG: DUF4191 domain-containing protein [Rothia sp. (in: high G+C Gram-positive bacteria)]|uniref:DUF4191 domain-containing protein n=1 Tax=Rothia sp. (in: high G+C Gram-positive bacteria) TaxID=1885016 RepID=UPI0026DEBB6B|nr:DUF4191 domain-containing protein [Rothia sp. (in: high G+C Gram-positive bacteria)]MDO5750167.1 DUF4191 domain-containing protein [Rothia sp. (in: high G+C Gram-positive bacteria)]
MAEKKQKKERRPGTFSQIKQVYRETKKQDPNIGWILLLASLGTLLVSLVIGVLLGNWITFLILGLGLAAIVAMLILGRRARTAAYAQIEDQPGRSGAVLNSIRRGWIVEEQPVAANRAQDVVFRAVGKPGIVLVTEGPWSRVKPLVEKEKKNLRIVTPNVPVHVIQTGHDEGQVDLKDLEKTMKGLTKVMKEQGKDIRLTNEEMHKVSQRLQTMNNMRNPMRAMPKGIDPMRARPDRRAMRGR